MAQHKLVVIKKPLHTDQKDYVLGAETGSPTSPINTRLSKIVKAIEDMRQRAQDVRSNRNFSPTEVQKRVREAVAPMLRELNEDYKWLGGTKGEVRAQADALTPGRKPKELCLLDALVVIERVKTYKEMPLAKRAALDHDLARNPTLHLGMAEMVTWVSPDVSGAKPATVSAARMGMIKTFCRAEYDTLSQQMAELEIVENALRTGLTIARETTNNMDVIEFAKEAFLGLQGEPDPVRWPAPPVEVQSEQLASQHDPAPSPAQQFEGARDAE